MTVGTAAIGVSGLVFLAAVGHGGPDPAAAAALASVYLLSNILGPGVFVAVEHETSRRVAAAAPDGSGTGTARVVVTLAAATLLVLALAAVPLTTIALPGHPSLIGALALCVIGSAAVFRVRGVLGGQRRFRRYGGGLLVDAGVRIVGVLGLAAAGVTAAPPYALAWCAAPGVAALVTRPRTAPAVDGRRAGRGVASLLIGSVAAMTVANLAPVLVTAALPDDPARAFGFACALVLTRAPLLLVGPVQAVLLPSLASAAAAGRFDEVRALVRRGLLVVAAIGGLAVVCAPVFGRPAVRLAFGAAADSTPAAVIAALAAAAALLMAVALVQPALVALQAHRSLVTGWIVAAAAFAVTFAALVGVDPVTAAIAAGVAAPATALLIQLRPLLRPGPVDRRAAPPRPGSGNEPPRGSTA